MYCPGVEEAMVEVNLSKLSRADLLKLLIAQGERLEAAEAELAEAKRQLEERRILASECGSIAEVAARISGLLNSAQDAADLYLQNVRRMYPMPGEGEQKNNAASSAEEDQNE